MSNLESVKIDTNIDFGKKTGPIGWFPQQSLSKPVNSGLDNSSIESVDLSSNVSANVGTNLLANLSTTHQTSDHTSNSNRGVRLNGTAGYDDSNMIYIKPDRNGCNQMAGACENDEYLIVSYKDSDDTMQKIVFYDKKTNEPVGEFKTDKFGHSNALTISGDTVYVVKATGNDDKVCSFSLSEALDKCSYSESGNFNTLDLLTGGISYFVRQIDDTPEITESDFNIGSNDKDITNLTSLAYDPKSGVTAAAYGDDLFIVKDGKLTKVKKINYSDQFARTNQDLCVAKDSVYVIRTKISDDDDENAFELLSEKAGEFLGIPHKKRLSGTKYVDDSLLPPSGEDRNQTVKKEYLNEYNLIDIYDLDGNYVCTKKLPIPEGSNDSKESIYRELESISYDETTDSFTMYFNNPFRGATDDHVIVRGVDLPSAEKSIPKIEPQGPLMSA